MTTNKAQAEPIFNVPRVITAVLAVLVGIHGLRQLLSEANEEWLLLVLAFIPDRYGPNMGVWPGGVISAWTSPFTHMLVHGDWMHLTLNGASLLAFGGVVARRSGSLRFLLFSVFAGLCGVLTFYVVNPHLAAPMIGASGAISGMMAAALRLMFSAVDTAPPGQVGELVRQRPELIELQGLSAVVRDPRMRSSTALWVVINALGAYGLGTPGHPGEIAWEAHIGGFLAGLFGFGLFDRGALPHAGVIGPKGGHPLEPDTSPEPKSIS